MALEKGGVKCERVLKIQEGRPNAGDMLKNGEISMLLLTTTGKRRQRRELFCHLRRGSAYELLCMMTAAMLAAVQLLRPPASDEGSTPPHLNLKDTCTQFPYDLPGDEPDVRDGKDLRRLALALKVPIITTVAGAVATANALKGLRNKPLQHVRSLTCLL